MKGGKRGGKLKEYIQCCSLGRGDRNRIRIQVDPNEFEISEELEWFNVLHIFLMPLIQINTCSVIEFKMRNSIPRLRLRHKFIIVCTQITCSGNSAKDRPEEEAFSSDRFEKDRKGRQRIMK